GVQPLGVGRVGSSTRGVVLADDHFDPTAFLQAAEADAMVVKIAPEAVADSADVQGDLSGKATRIVPIAVAADAKAFRIGNCRQAKEDGGAPGHQGGLAVLVGTDQDAQMARKLRPDLAPVWPKSPKGERFDHDGTAQRVASSFPSA